MDRLLVTGSNGKIGTVLCKALREQYLIYTSDRTKKRSNTHFVADISDFTALDNVFGGIKGLKYVVHLAANANPNAKLKSVFKNNIIGTHNVYECARRHGVKRIVFASSNHVTGGYKGMRPPLSPKARPKMISPKDPIKPDGYYG